MPKPLSIAIVGGSIAGCSAGILLTRSGANVDIFERSSNTWERKGAGITLPENLVQQCINLDLLDSNLPRLSTTKRVFFIRQNSAKTKQIWQQPVQVVTLNWGDVYANLRKRIVDELYHPGVNIQEISLTDQGCSLKTLRQDTQEFDYVIAADGVDSRLRQQIFPADLPCYAGYIAWRGVIDDPAYVEKACFTDQLAYYMFPKGHLLLYQIPAPDYKSTGKRLLNWVLYQAYAVEILPSLLVDNKGLQHQFSLPPGSLGSHQLNYLHELVKRELPMEIAEIIMQTEKPFIQTIFDLQLSQRIKDKVCFIGDAATLLRPHSASGILNSLQDSMSLAAAFNGSDLSTALANWSDSQIQLAKQQITLAKTMGENLVNHSPDWSGMTQTRMDTWWQTVMANKTWYATKR